MPSDRQRILELALETLQEQRKRLDEEIAEITRELRGKRPARGPARSTPAASARSTEKRSQFSKEERRRRSERMKAYWDNWRKKKSRKPAR